MGHGTVHVCPNCLKTYSHKRSLDRHTKYECSCKRQFQCPQCNKSFSQRGTLFKHQVSIHKTSPSGQKKKYSSNGASHIENWHEIVKVGGMYSCKRCSKTYSYVGNLRRHLKHECRYLKEFRCLECGEIFTTISSLKDHRVNVHLTQLELDEQSNRNIKEMYEDYYYDP
ncbi:zinc finger protein 814-like [Sitophilus oryzae]|uniref:Zinc finger protein 814-like n=1 Tax=Sitophilus oryzae TaxID=7048 RepID=A0A6J2YR66_SITOR|nr:zinc finger protein 814-like [Sitophilus oryzae]